MSNNKNHRRRSNSLDLNQNQNKTNDELKDENDDILSKSILLKKKEMITYKNIQNIELNTYDYIFVGRQFYEGNVHDFSSFIQYLNNIKSKYNPSLMKNNEISENIKKEGKFSFTHDNITKLISFHKKRNKNIEISTNTRYIKTYNLDNNYINFYTSKSLFKGKHCFEIEILNIEQPNLSFGLINTTYIEPFRNTFKDTSLFKINVLSQLNIDNIIFFKISEPFFIQKNGEIYNHYISYGDILGCCYDFEKKLFYLFLNGEIVNTFVLNIKIGKYMSFLPIISIGNYTEIIFNPGHNLEYIKSYENFGFVPLDEKGKNNYEISKLREVTDQYKDILIYNGKTIINSQKISYSDINQIYHIIFDFLGNVSFQHSYIIQKSFIEPYLLKLNKVDYKDFDLYYLILKYILNLSKDKKLIIKNIFLNLSETIHIFLRKGIKFLNQISILLNLLIYLFGKTEIINILSKMPKTLTKIFRSIFVSFHIHDSKLEKDNFDFIIKKNDNINISNNNNNTISFNRNNNNNINNNQQSNNNININNRINIQNIGTRIENALNNNNNNHNINNSYFPNIIISKDTLIRIIDLNQINLLTITKEIIDLYSKLIIILFKNGTENENKNIYNIFKIFYEKETNSTLKYSLIRKNSYIFFDLFKTIFISAMKSFNNEYTKKDRIISIKKYLSEYEVDGEKIGGTIKHIHEVFSKQIPNFEDLLKYKINKYDNIIFIELLYIFFVKEYSENFWGLLISTIKKMINCFNLNFLKNVKNESFEKIHASLIDYVNYNLNLINLDDLEIFIQFLYNLSDFILNELYPKKLIYFIPEIIIFKFEFVFNFIIQATSFIKLHYDKQKFNSLRDGKKEEFISKLMKLSMKCFEKYLSILIKILEDQNIKKLELKCISVENLKNYLYLVEYFSDENLNSIFTFINLIHNNSEYNNYTQRFLKIFDSQINLKTSKYFNLALRINKLCQNNKNFIRTIILLLYNNMNTSLSRLGERFCEYKFKSISSQNQTNQINNINNNNNQINNINNNNQIVNNNYQINNINNNNNNQINNNINNNQINAINNNQNNNINNPFEFFFIGFEIRRNNRVRNPLFIIRRNNAQLSDHDKLVLLEESFNDVRSQFLKLIHFYQISSDIKELYDFNSFENKILINLLLNLYNVIFSPNNMKKIDEKNIPYKKLLNEVNNFYNIIISNIINQKNQDILKEISKQRNILHFKEILQSLEKFNPVKDEKDDRYKYFKDFIEQLEKLVPEEEVKTKIDIDNDKEMTKSGNKIDNNLCTICADSAIDTHLIPCDHSLCRNCFFQCLSENKTCPFCRVEIKGIKEELDFKIIN